MPRLNVFAKGNLDLRDSLHSLRIGGETRWNGINDVVRTRFPGSVVRILHEVCTRSDALLVATGGVPQELLKRAPALGVYSLTAQFSAAMFDSDADAFVLSIQPDVLTQLVRHRKLGYLFCAHEWERWPAHDRDWLRAEFEPTGLIDCSASMRNLEAVIQRLRTRSTAPVLIYNMSAFIPGERVHNFAGLGDMLSTRIRRFNLALIELSERTGVSVIDVDAILARAGAERLKIDAVHLAPEGCRLVAEEVVRVLAEHGCLPERVEKQCA